jgi:hypothetical protein
MGVAIRTVRVYKRATGWKVKRAGHFYTHDIPRKEMDVCPRCIDQLHCPIKENFHPDECAINCDYWEGATT